MRAGKNPSGFGYHGVGNELAGGGGQVRTGGSYTSSDQLPAVTTTASGGSPAGHTFGYSGTDNTGVDVSFDR